MCKNLKIFQIQHFTVAQYIYFDHTFLIRLICSQWFFRTSVTRIRSNIPVHTRAVTCGMFISNCRGSREYAPCTRVRTTFARLDDRKSRLAERAYARPRRCLPRDINHITWVIQRTYALLWYSSMSLIDYGTLPRDAVVADAVVTTLYLYVRRYLDIVAASRFCFFLFHIFATNVFLVIVSESQDPEG